MGINDNTKGMIDALAKGDIAKAKAYAQCVIANDSSEKNRYWRDKTSLLLKTGDEKNLELPTALYSLCELIKPGSDFRADQYYLSKAEAPVVDEIIGKQEIVKRMQVLGVPAVNTTLLYGKPGTGKTELAKYIAYKLDKPLLILRFSNLIDSYLGGTGKNIGQVFDFFRQNDIVLFLDEIDTVASKRDGGHGCDGEISRTTACIMQELDRMNGGGIVIAATNRSDLLDEALLLVTDKAHRLGMHISHICAWGTSKFAYDGSGIVERGINGSYSICRFQNGRTYNCDLAASYNIGARYFIREIVKSLPATARLHIEAEVPQCCKRSTCTFSTLISLNAALMSA